jgi:hypothetical protein
MKGVLPWLLRLARRAGTRDFCPALACSSQPIIFLTVHFSTLLVPIAQQPGQAVVLGRLSLSLGRSVNIVATVVPMCMYMHNTH